jgi:hypothetical protein
MTVDPRVKERVDEFLATLERAPVSRFVLGVVISGSAARGEEIWHGDELVSDIDLMVLTRRTDPRLIAGIERVVAAHRDRGVDGGQVPLGPLARYLTLAFFEARETGVAVRGDVDVRRLIPPTDPADLPVWEGVRVLANRLLEHVKHDEGLVEPDRVAAKSYEALAEAYLLAEGRYRPTYAARLREIEHAAPEVPAEVVASMVAALRYRLGQGPPPDLDLAAARAHLVAGLGRIAGVYTGTAGDPAAQLRRLARVERHLRHRVYWAGRAAAQRRWADVDLAVDPVIKVWQRALALVTEGSTVEQRRRLLADWRACPQILVRRPR